MTNYAKLNDGSWGIRSDKKLTVGQILTVTKRDGTSKSETVSRVVTSGVGYSIATIRSSANASPSYASRRTSSPRRLRCSDGFFSDTCRRPGCNCGGFDNE